jgi:short subunit dehydrogenase-like uncharacterized protein
MGATGFTGRIIARELVSRDIPFTIAARDESRALQLRSELGTQSAVAIVDVRDPVQIEPLLDGTGIVINCVGPYNLYGQGVLESCSTRDVVYMDLSGEQEFIRRSLDDPGAAGRPATILHSIAFESALADLLAAEMLRGDTTYRSICSYYSFAQSRPSPGTALTMRLARHFPTYHVASGRLVRAAPLSVEHQVDLGPTERSRTAFFMPYPEVLFFRHRYRTTSASSYLVLDDGEASFARAGRDRPVPALGSILEHHERRRRDGPSAAERSKQAFTLDVVAVGSDGTRHTRRLSGSDMYEISATLVTHVVEAVLLGAKLPAGVWTPSQAPVWDGIWSRLQDRGLISAPRGVA